MAVAPAVEVVASAVAVASVAVEFVAVGFVAVESVAGYVVGYDLDSDSGS